MRKPLFLAWLAIALLSAFLAKTSLLFWLLWLVLLIGLPAILLVPKSLTREERIRLRDATTPSPLEAAIERELRNRSIPFEREFAISKIHVDFAFPKHKLAVECDGYRYHHDRTAQDAARDAFLQRQGWRVLRLQGDQIRSDPRLCVRRISEELAKSSGFAS
jgi:very-short-patch-repair endonuclease